MTAAALLSQAHRAAGPTRRMAARRAGVAQPTLPGGVRLPAAVAANLDRLLAGCGYRASLALEALPDPHELGVLETTLALTPPNASSG